MMPQLSTPVVVPKPPFALRPADRILTLGSCFADEVAQRMADSGLQVLANPFGTLYNPLSVAQALEALVDGRRLDDACLVFHDGLWHSWLHHGRFSRPDRDACLAACHSAMAQARTDLAGADLLVLTFGTAFVFELRQPTAPDAPRVVANCHKLPPDTFLRRRLSVDEIVAAWRPLLVRLRDFNPGLKVLFTVSPIRHMADGAHGNQLSKASLLLAVDRLLEAPARQPQALYFPAYEILLDELRDYRFYAPDLVHPSPTAADIVWHRFQEAFFSPADRQQLHLAARRALRDRHQPLH